MSLDRLAPAIFVFLWSTGWVTAKYAVYYTGPLTFLCLRYLLAGVLLWAICRFSSIQWPPKVVSISSGRSCQASSSTVFISA